MHQHHRDAEGLVGEIVFGSPVITSAIDLCGIESAGDDAKNDVAFREDAEQALVVDDQNGANRTARHRPRRLAHGCCGAASSSLRATMTSLTGVLNIAPPEVSVHFDRTDHSKKS